MHSDKEYEPPQPPSARELFAFLKTNQHRGEGWELVNTTTGGLCLRQSSSAISPTPEAAITALMKRK